MSKPEITNEMLMAAERQAAALRARGVECTADELVVASMISNQIETTITLNPAMATKGTRKLAGTDPLGVVLCLHLARALPKIREATTLDEQVGALNEGLTPVLAQLTQSIAGALSKLGR